jgi:D-arabinose 1-dehydrogenase-like Zn-dependent alcohol dehydrogenase
MADEPTMTVMVLDRFGGSFRAERRPVPRPGHGDVLVDVVTCGAGLTLEHGRLGVLGGSTPRVLGHELAGVIAAVGPGVTHWAPGDRVTASFYLLCGNCDMCASGRESLCRNNRGFYGLAVDGAFGEKAVVPAHSLVRVPEDIGLRAAAVVADAVATPYHVASQRIGIRPGQRVAVIGAGGGVGVHMVQVARAFGAQVIGVERDGGKLAELEKRGLADVLVDSGEPDWPRELARCAGERLDACVDTVSSQETLDGGIAALGTGGTFVVVGHRTGTEVRVPSTRLLLGELVVTGNRYATRAEIAASLELVRTGRVEPIIGLELPLAQLDDAFAAIRANEVFGRILIDCAGGAGGT